MSRHEGTSFAHPITRSSDHPIPPYPPARTPFALLYRPLLSAARTTLIAAATTLVACAGEASPPAAPAGAGADSASALLARVSPALAAEAFARLQANAYTAEVRMQDGDAPATIRRVRHVPGAAADNVDERLLVDPVSRMVPDTPPHLAARTRDRYRVRLLPEVERGDRRLAGAEASLLDPADQEPVRRVRSWIDAGTGAPYAVEVWRSSDAAIFDEESRAGVLFSARAGAILPWASSSVSHVGVPFGESRLVRVDVTILDVDS